MEKQQKFLKAKEVAEGFFEGKIRYNKILELSKRGILPCTKIGGIYYYTVEALEEWVLKNMHTPVWQKSK